jgi:hypothetical protein
MWLVARWRAFFRIPDFSNFSRQHCRSGNEASSHPYLPGTWSMLILYGNRRIENVDMVGATTLIPPSLNCRRMIMQYSTKTPVRTHRQNQIMAHGHGRQVATLVCRPCIVTFASARQCRVLQDFILHKLCTRNRF